MHGKDFDEGDFKFTSLYLVVHKMILISNHLREAYCSKVCLFKTDVIGSLSLFLLFWKEENISLAHGIFSRMN